MEGGGDLVREVGLVALPAEAAGLDVLLAVLAHHHRAGDAVAVEIVGIGLLGEPGQRHALQQAAAMQVRRQARRDPGEVGELVLPIDPDARPAQLNRRAIAQRFGVALKREMQLALRL